MARTFGNLIQKYPITLNRFACLRREWVKTSDVPLFALLGISILSCGARRQLFFVNHAKALTPVDLQRPLNPQP